jgi:uncharacterized repeat protein (TIGR01451 family)
MNPSSRGPLWFGIILVVVILGVAGWIYFLQPNQNLQVDVAMSANPSSVLVGDPFTLSVVLTNNSGATLKNATINLVLPSGVASVNSPNQRVLTQTLGNVDANGVSHEDFPIVVTGAPNSVIPISAKVTYNAAGSSAQFESDSAMSLAVGQPVVSVSVAAPATVFSGQNFPIAVSYNNNADHPVQGFSLAMQYPSEFSSASASSSLQANGSNAWSLGTLPPNASGTVIVTGNLVGGTSAPYPIGATLSESIGGQLYTILNPAANVSLSEPPISVAITANGSNNYIAHPGDQITYALKFTNNASVAFQNIVLSTKLSGTMFDLSSIQANGSFDSFNNTITWNGGEDSQLLSLAPGQSGVITFYVSTKSAFPIKFLGDKNYSVALDARLSSPTVPPGTSASSTITVANLTTKFGGAMTLAMTGYHKDPSKLAAVADSGPYPPKVNQATQYMIHWIVTNYATDANNVTISAYLQSGTICTGFVTSTAPTAPQCNPANGQITWQIPTVPAGTGIADRSYEALIQVDNTPGLNQVNQNVTLISGATLSATDGFTGAPLSANTQALTTALPDDTSLSANAIREVTQ